MATRRLDIPDDLNLDIKQEAVELSREKKRDVFRMEAILDLTSEGLKIRKAIRNTPKNAKVLILGKEYELVLIK